MWLGVIHFIEPARIWGRVRPLYEVSEPQWREADSSDFKTEGLVYWSRPKEGVTGNLIYFQMEANTGEKDRNKVVNPELAVELLDIRKLGGVEATRVGATMGLHLSAEPSARVALWVTDQLLLGPVRLVPGRPGTWMLEQNARSRVRWNHFSKAIVKKIPWGATSRYILVGGLQAQPDGYYDWDEDRLVVRRALEFAARSAAAKPSIPTTRAMLTAAAEAAVSLGDAPEVQLDTYRVRRALSIIPTVESFGPDADGLAKAVLELPAAKSLLSDAAVSFRATYRAEVREEIAAEMNSLKQAREQKAKLEQDIKSLSAELFKAAKGQEEAIRQVEREVAERLKAVLERPAAVMADAAVLRPLLGTSSPRLAGATGQRPRLDRWKIEAALPDVQSLRKEIVGSFGAKGLSGALGMTLHGAFGARLVPLVAGPAALDALSAYCDVVAKGRLTVIEARPEIACGRDLFGALDPTRGRYLPDADGLLDLVLAAAESTGLERRSG